MSAVRTQFNWYIKLMQNYLQPDGLIFLHYDEQSYSLGFTIYSVYQIFNSNSMDKIDKKIKFQLNQTI